MINGSNLMGTRKNDLPWVFTLKTIVGMGIGVDTILPNHTHTSIICLLHFVNRI